MLCKIAKTFMEKGCVVLKMILSLQFAPLL